MAQRLDVEIVRTDGTVATLLNQKSDSDALWTRLRKAAQTARSIDITRHAVAPPPPPPPGGFGTAADAGPFAGRGIMLGSNPDVWDQALGLARAGQLEVVAATRSTFLTVAVLFAGTATRVVQWAPPEQQPGSASILQAENQPEWNTIIPALNPPPRAIVLNSWLYGTFPAKTPALVEAYYNEGQAVDFGIYHNYMAQKASAVIPVCGGYATTIVPNAQAAAIYQHLATWSGGPFPGFWMYAGESLITPESLEVLKAWRP